MPTDFGKSGREPRDAVEYFADRVASTVQQGDQLLEEAEVLHSPVLISSSRTHRDKSTDSDATADKKSWNAALLNTLWLVCVLVVHAAVFPLLLGAMVTATAILAWVGWVVADRWIGFPVLSICAGLLGTLAAVEIPRTVIRSFKGMRSKCPW